MLSDWAGDYSHPALKYIETRWASMISGFEVQWNENVR
ncbi:sea15 domain protein (plasmid) [Enterobacter hormaechei subsp. hoffmannii]|nr:sea15 domain protein [Enterobacter hormaechei subsp. hoffmannii]